MPAAVAMLIRRGQSSQPMPALATRIEASSTQVAAFAIFVRTRFSTGKYGDLPT
jgi:hypothetical protein